MVSSLKTASIHDGICQTVILIFSLGFKVMQRITKTELFFFFQLYKRYDPTTSDEIEFMENLFNCLCSSLMCNPNKDLFLKGEGLQLMILMLR